MLVNAVNLAHAQWQQMCLTVVCAEMLFGAVADDQHAESTLMQLEYKCAAEAANVQAQVCTLGCQG